MTEPNPPASTTKTPVEIDALLETYETQAEWIRFADAKAGAVLTANGALIGLLVPTLSTLRSTTGPLALAPLLLFVPWLVLASVSAVRAFQCISPFRRSGRHPAEEVCPHFHSVGIAHHYGMNDLDRFVADADAKGAEGFRREILGAMLVDAYVSTSKYTHVAAAIRLLGVSAVFAVLYVLALEVPAFLPDGG